MSPDGGIGRRASFRDYCWQQRAGSTPVPGTLLSAGGEIGIHATLRG